MAGKGAEAMQEEPPRFNFMREFGQTVDNAIGNAQDRARGAFRNTNVAISGRGLTAGEMNMIRAMFGTTVGFARARVYPRNFWWPYPFKRAMTPEGNIYFPGGDYRDDYSSLMVPLWLRALFMHEATHLYQWYVLRQVVFVRGLFNRNYDYKLVPGKALKDYGLEQMGQIVQDYYTIQHGGFVEGITYGVRDYRDALPVRR